MLIAGYIPQAEQFCANCTNRTKQTDDGGRKTGLEEPLLIPNRHTAGEIIFIAGVNYL